MNKYPKMITEIIEAVESTFCDYPSVKVDCMLYLLNALAREEDVRLVRAWFDENKKCSKCGVDLIPYTIKQPHSEISLDCYEKITTYMCPYTHCDN